MKRYRVVARQYDENKVEVSKVMKFVFAYNIQEVQRRAATFLNPAFPNVTIAIKLDPVTGS